MGVRDGGKHRILLVIDRLGWAGAETQLAHLAEELHVAGHTVRLLAVGPDTAELQNLRGIGLQTASLGGEGRWGKLAKVPAIARHARWADVVHCTGWDGTLWGRLGGALARRPVLFTEHTPGRQHQVTPDGESRARPIEIHNRLLDRFTYATIIVGAWQRELLISEGVRPETIVHIPNGVPIATLRDQAAKGAKRQDFDIPPDARVVVQMARITTQKRQLLTVDVIAKLRERLGDIRLLLVGGGMEEDLVRAGVEERGADWVQMLGRRSDPAAILGLADLSVLPSTAEGMPMSLIESVAVGTPVVATDVGDVSWFVHRSGGGMVVPVDSPEEFEAACERILADPGLHADLVAAGEASICEFDSSTMTKRYEAVFDAAVAGAPVPTELPVLGAPK